MHQGPLTDRQQQVVDYMVEFFRAEDQLPPTSFICREFGWSSPNSATTMLKQLERRGWIVKNVAGKYRWKRPEDST